MKGLLKTKPAWNQFIVLVSLALVSFFVLGFIGTLLVTTVTGMGLKELNDLVKMDFSQPGAIAFLRGMQVVQFISLFIVPVFLCAWLFSTDTKKYLGLKKPSHMGYFIAGIAVMLLAIPLTNLLGELNRSMRLAPGVENWMKKTEDEAARTIRTLLSKHSIKDLIINVLCIAGLAAVGEELLFRGMAQRLFIKMFKSPWAGIIIAAVLFSAIHMQFYGFLPRFVLGVLLGAIYWYSGSIWVAMLAHFAYDSLLIVFVYFNPGMLNDESSARLSNIGLAGALGALLVVFLLIWMKKRSTTTYQNIYAEDAIPVKSHPF